MLDFLKTATISDVAETKAVHRGGVRKQRNPDGGLQIRVFKDGSVYPSSELVSKFDLEYQPKDALLTGNGLDVVDTALYPAFKAQGRAILVSPVSRKEGKIDLFSSTGYDEKGEPRASVLEQGAKTYGKDDLIPMMEVVYGIKFQEEQNYIDLELVADPATGKPWSLPKGKLVTFLPKAVSRGKDKGSISTVRREKPEFWALVPVSLLDKGEGSEQEANMQPEPADLFEGIEA